MSEFSLKKRERLSSTKIIDKLFAEGISFFIYPFKVVFIETPLPDASPVQAAFSVSKRNFKKAVHRNLIKRRMREAYRLNKSILYQQVTENKQLAVMLIYTGKTIEEFGTIEENMKKVLVSLIRRLQKKGSADQQTPSSQ